MEIDNEEIKQMKKNMDADLADLQKCDVFVQQLPYFDKIKASGRLAFAEIKQNILTCLYLNEIRPGLIHWSNRLIVFIHEYGLFFTKKDHVDLVELYVEIALTANIDLPTVEFCLNVLIELLK